MLYCWNSKYKSTWLFVILISVLKSIIAKEEAKILAVPRCQRYQNRITTEDSCIRSSVWTNSDLSKNMNGIAVRFHSLAVQAILEEGVPLPS